MQSVVPEIDESVSENDNQASVSSGIECDKQVCENCQLFLILLVARRS